MLSRTWVLSHHSGKDMEFKGGLRENGLNKRQLKGLSRKRVKEGRVKRGKKNNGTFNNIISWSLVLKLKYG